MATFGLSLALILLLLFLLGSGVWVGLSLIGVAWIGMVEILGRAPGDAMAMTIWGSASSWTLTALPLFIWMGEILVRTRLSEDLFKGLAPWMGRLPGGLIHTNVIGCTLFAAVSGSSVATCATVGKMTLPELKARGYPDSISIGTLAGAATLGLLVPPSIVMIVYGVAANVSIVELFIAGVIPGLLLAGMMMSYILVWSIFNRDSLPRVADQMRFWEKVKASRNLIPIVLLISGVLGAIYIGFATATEAAALGVIGSLLLGWMQRSLTWSKLWESIMGATRLYCMIGLILSGAAFLTLAMGYIGLPRDLAIAIDAMNLSQLGLISMLLVFFIIFGCFLDGISLIVLTMVIMLPMIEGAGIDLVWFGIFAVIAIEMSSITPPVGLNIFVIQGLTGKGLLWVARAAFPMFLLLVAATGLIYYFPELVLWLPSKMQ